MQRVALCDSQQENDAQQQGLPDSMPAKTETAASSPRLIRAVIVRIREFIETSFGAAQQVRRTCMHCWRDGKPSQSQSEKHWRQGLLNCLTGSICVEAIEEFEKSSAQLARNCIADDKTR